MFDEWSHSINVYICFIIRNIFQNENQCANRITIYLLLWIHPDSKPCGIISTEGSTQLWINRYRNSYIDEVAKFEWEKYYILTNAGNLTTSDTLGLKYCRITMPNGKTIISLCKWHEVRLAMYRYPDPRYDASMYRLIDTSSHTRIGGWTIPLYYAFLRDNHHNTYMSNRYRKVRSLRTSL